MNFIKRLRAYKNKNKLKQVSSMSSTTIFLDSVTIDMRIQNDRTRVFLGENSIIGCNFIFESSYGNVMIGQRCYIGAGTNLIAHSDINIGDDVTIAWGVCIYTHDSHSLDWRERVKDISKEHADLLAGKNLIASKDWSVVNTAPINIKNKAWIGMNVIILKGVTIGEGAIVAAGSVVTKDVQPWTVVAGNPAKVVKILNDDGETDSLCKEF